MKWTIDQKAWDYCKEKKISIVTIAIVVAGACGGGGVSEPIVNIGKPQDKKIHYQKIKKEGLEIYIPSYLYHSNQHLTLTVKKSFMIRHLGVEGLKTTL